MKLPSAFIIGDSISIGYDPYLHKYLKGKFRYLRKQGAKEALWNTGIQMGANGGDSSLVLKFLCSNHVHKEIPEVDYLLFNCGLHDIKTDPVSKKKQTSLSKYKENILSILQGANKYADRVIWINTTPVNTARHNALCKDFFRYNKDVQTYNRVAQKIMQKNKIPIIDLNSLIRIRGHNAYIDHVHFKEKIYKKQGRHIARFLLEQHYLDVSKKRGLASTTGLSADIPPFR